ncbi:MAG TPA: alpha/beta fold hydrolase [Acetobacteraceae bacterium]|nr:alpha/beta fold hydrolase [Acetobacteraceae bacterium]
MTASSIYRAGIWIGAAAAGLIVAAVAALTGLIICGTASPPRELTSVSDPMRHIDFSNLPKLQQFHARDGQALSYRVYPGAGPDVIVLIHGSSGESSGMHAVAMAMNSTGDTIFVPDLRGHGHDGRAGDIDYIGQLDDDLADLVGVVRSRHPSGNLILVGHSSGGGFVFRIAEGPYAPLFNRFVLLSPTMPYDAVTYRPHVGGWAAPFVGRIVALKILNRLDMPWFNGLTAVAFAVDPHASVPLDAAYSYRLVADFGAPPDALGRLAAVHQPLAIVIGADDELFYADRYGPLIHAVRQDVPVTLVPGVSHMGMVTDPRALDASVAAIR